MNNNFDHTFCSRTSVERYLLNRMSTDEETLFQEHLYTCDACRVYLSSLRNLAGMSNDEATNPAIMTVKMPKPAAETREKKQTKVFPLSVTMRWMLAAACLIPVGGILLYSFLREPGIAHNTQIMHQNRASVEYADTSGSNLSLSGDTIIVHDSLYLFSPDQPSCIIDPTEEEIVFRWNRESGYQLLLEVDGKTIANIDSVGTACTVDSALAIKYEHLDWTLTIEGKELKGKLYIQTK